ncbi:MAG: hypothetical protein FWC26_12430 [Fibromonadales bacterium]|nr:hypothetical protein [Fibromonadales bacterium]
MKRMIVLTVFAVALMTGNAIADKWYQKAAKSFVEADKANRPEIYEQQEAQKKEQEKERLRQECTKQCIPSCSEANKDSNDYIAGGKCLQDCTSNCRSRY